MDMESHSRVGSGVGKCFGKGLNEGKCLKQGFHERENKVQGEGASEASFPTLHARFSCPLGESSEMVRGI